MDRRDVDAALELARERGWVDVLIREYRRAAGLANAGGTGDRDHEQAMWEMRGARVPETRRAPLVGWSEHGYPAGLTRLGALVAAELNRGRTRHRQVAEAVAQDEIRRRSMDRGQLIHEWLEEAGIKVHADPAIPPDEVIGVSREAHEAFHSFGQSAEEAARAFSTLKDSMSKVGRSAADFRFEFAPGSPFGVQQITGLGG